MKQNLVLVDEGDEAIAFVVRIESEGLPLPAAVHPVGPQKVVQARHKCPGGLAEVHGGQLQLRFGHHVYECPQDLVQFSPTLSKAKTI